VKKSWNFTRFFAGIMPDFACSDGKCLFFTLNYRLKKQGEYF